MLSKWIVFTGLIFLLTNCTRSVENQKVNIVLPQNTQSKTFAPESSSVQNQSVSSLSTPFGMGSVFDVLDVNCYMLLVDDSAGDFGALKCKNESGDEKRFLRAVAGISASANGQKVELLLPTGSKRKLFLFGIKAEAGTCIPPKQDPSAPMSWTRPRLLTSVEVELQGSEQTTTMQLPAGDVSSKLEFVGCELDAGMQPVAGIQDLESSFGSGRDGDLLINSSTAIDLSTRVNTIEGQSVYYSSSFKVESVDSFDAKKITLDYSPVGSPNYLIPNDLVLFHVTAADNPNGGCYSGMPLGRYSYARVTQISGSQIALDRPIFDLPALSSGDKTAINNRFSTLPIAGNSFCRVTMTRVPEFRNIVYQLSSGSNIFTYITSSSFNAVTYTGGILAFKVKDGLILDDINITGDNGLVFDMSAKGFTGAASSKTGSGILGRVNSTSNIGNGGVGSLVAVAAGGSNVGKGRDDVGGTLMSGNRVQDILALGSVPIPAAERKLFHGGQGGMKGANVGGQGGGIIIAQIHHVDLNAQQSANGSKLKFLVDGGDQSGGSGAGAGGSVYVAVKHVSNNLYTQNEIRLYAEGGVGSSGSGDGGAGLIELQYCQDSDVVDVNGNSSIYEWASFPNVSGGTGADIIPTGANGVPGHDGKGGFTRAVGSLPPLYCSQ